jgi:kynurenine formamidase
MDIQFIFKGKNVNVNLDKPIDISLELIPGKIGVNCFYAPVFDARPVIEGSFVGSTKEGGAVNFKNVTINPHGNGTHTECVGHISKEEVSINEVLKSFHFITKVVSLYPELQKDGDRIVTLKQLKEVFSPNEVESLTIRTLPNFIDKKERNYSGTNPPYIQSEGLKYLIKNGLKHFLIDLPSVDREEDGGKLSAHKAFWEYPESINLERTITELVYIPEEIKDGYYLINLQIISFVLDASPSKPVLYELQPC